MERRVREHPFFEVVDGGESFVGHFKHSHIVRTSKSIFLVSDKSKLPVAFSFDIQDSIDDMFEVFWTCDFTSLGDVSDHEECCSCILGCMIEGVTTNSYLTW